MISARVVGAASSTIRHASLAGWRLLVVQPSMADGEAPDGEPLLAIDHLGAGIGDQVILTSDGRGTRELVGHDATPIRWSVLGLQD